MAKINDYKKEATLNKQFRYPEGLMTRRQWLNMMRIKGATVNEGTKNRIQFNRTKFNRMTEGQDEYMAKCNEMVICYELKLPDEISYWEITKTEYDYFKDLELSEDINTQKAELSEKIEAGIATDEEIDEAMQKEFEFAAKYF